jgi:hypothetical protein
MPLPFINCGNKRRLLWVKIKSWLCPILLHPTVRSSSIRIFVTAAINVWRIVLWMSTFPTPKKAVRLLYCTLMSAGIVDRVSTTVTVPGQSRLTGHYSSEDTGSAKPQGRYLELKEVPR